MTGQVPVRTTSQRTASGASVQRLRILLVVNSFASSVTARNTVVVHQELSRRARGRRSSRRTGGATPPASPRTPPTAGVDVVIGFGGDGTLNEVATGIAGTDTALGVLPGGSTNVFARTIGLPNDPVAAVKLLVDALDDATSIRPIGLGKVNGRYFCFHTGVGYDAAVVRTVERRASLKRGSAIRCSSTPRSRRGCRATTARRPTSRCGSRDGDRRSPTATSRSCSTPTPTPTSGTARSTCRPPPRSTGAWSPSRSARCGPAPSWPASAARSGAAGSSRADTSTAHTDLAAFVIEHDAPFPYQVDGDYLGETDRLEFRHVPDAVRLVTCHGRRRRRARSTEPQRARTGDVGHVRADAVDAPPGQPAHRPGSSHVHTFTATPCRWHSVDRPPRSTLPVPRVEGDVAGRARASGRDGRSGTSTHSQAVRISGANWRHRSITCRRTTRSATLRLAPTDERGDGGVGDRVGRVEVRLRPGRS